MNPIFTWIIAETTARTTAEKLVRRCPKCGRKQAVPKEKLMAKVKCEGCAARLSPAPGRKR
jgi:hypothetical protein